MSCILPPHTWIYGNNSALGWQAWLAHTCNTSQAPLLNLSSQNSNFTLPFFCQKMFCNSLKMKSDIFHLALPISGSHVTLSPNLSCLCSVCLNLKHLSMLPHHVECSSTSSPANQNLILYSSHKTQRQTAHILTRQQGKDWLPKGRQNSGTNPTPDIYSLVCVDLSKSVP